MLHKIICFRKTYLQDSRLFMVGKILVPAEPQVLIENACYHIITRKNQRQQIFLDKKGFR